MLLDVTYDNKEEVDAYCDKYDVSIWLQNALYGIEQKFPDTTVRVSVKEDSEIRNDKYISVEFDVYLENDLDDYMYEYILSASDACIEMIMYCKTDGRVIVVPKLHRVDKQSD